MSAYYNEIDPFAAHCLRGLIADGVIAPGDVDERSIVDVQPDDLKGYTQCHFFAGGGLWSVAARMAGISDDEPLWTGSCPCQPLSVAGQGKGADDERHLWPAFYRLISERKPAIVFGEQVASALGREWFAGVRLDLEGLGHACGSADLCAAGVGAPQVRQRLYWVGVGDNYAMRKLQPQGRICDKRGWFGNASRCVDMANPESIGWRGRAHDENEWRWEQPLANPCAGSGGNEWRKVVYSKDCDENGICNQCGIKYSDCACFGPTQDNLEYKWNGETLYAKHMVNANGSTKARQRPVSISMEPKQEARRSCDATYWSGAELVTGADGKARRVKSGVRLLADGFPGRVGQLRIAGNAIVPQVAAAFMTASLEAM